MCKTEKVNGVFYTSLQIGPSSSSSCNEFPIAVSFFLSADAFASEEPPSHPRAGRLAAQAGLSRLKAMWKDPLEASSPRHFGVYF